MSSTGPLRHGMQTGVLPDSEQAFGTTGMLGGGANGSVGREKQGKQVCSRMDDICYTMFQVPMETRANAPTPFLFHPTRAAHTHHARTAW